MEGCDCVERRVTVWCTVSKRVNGVRKEFVVRLKVVCKRRTVCVEMSNCWHAHVNVCEWCVVC